MKNKYNLINVKVEPIENNDKNVLLVFCTVNETPIVKLEIDKEFVPKKAKKDITDEDLIAFIQMLFYGHTDLLQNWLSFGKVLQENCSNEGLDLLINNTKHTLGVSDEEG